jgi:hypothetical protein
LILLALIMNKLILSIVKSRYNELRVTDYKRGCKWEVSWVEDNEEGEGQRQRLDYRNITWK